MPLYTPYARKTIYSTSPQASATMGRRTLLPEEYFGLQRMEPPAQPEPEARNVPITNTPACLGSSLPDEARIRREAVLQSLFATGPSGEGTPAAGMPPGATPAETNPSPTQGLDVLGMSQGKGTIGEAAQNAAAVFGHALFGPFGILGKVAVTTALKGIKGLFTGKGEPNQGLPSEIGLGGVGVPSGGGFPGPEGFGGVAVPSNPAGPPVLGLGGYRNSGSGWSRWSRFRRRICSRRCIRRCYVYLRGRSLGQC